VPAEVVAVVTKKNETDKSVSFFYNDYLLKYEINAPITPIKAKPNITKPIGILPADDVWLSSTKFGMTNSGAGVKVGSLVGVEGIIKAAARVGSIVGVVCGVGVGGGSTIGKKPISLNVTNGA
jgi:hypothetical protein